MNFIFLKFFLIVYFSKTIICDSSVIIPLGVMLVNHKIQIFLIILFVSLNLLISIGMEGLVGYARHISNVDSAREGDLRIPKPERPSSRSHPVGHGTRVTSSICNTIDFCLYAAVFSMECCAEDVPHVTPS